MAKSAAADQEQAVAEARVEEKEIAKQQLEDLRQLKEQEQEEAIAKLKVGTIRPFFWLPTKNLKLNNLRLCSKL